jgi:hypothetical protein
LQNLLIYDTKQFSVRFPDDSASVAQASWMAICSHFPFDFDTIFNFFYGFHYTIVITFSDGNKTPTDFEIFW